jgi:hypothetical protein
VLQHDLVALNLGVQARILLERANHRLGEERHEAQPDAVPLLKSVAPPLAQFHHCAHIHLIEGGQHRRRVLRLHQPPRDGLTPPRHADTLLAARRGVAEGRGRARLPEGRQRGRWHRRPGGRWRRDRLLLRWVRWQRRRLRLSL